MYRIETYIRSTVGTRTFSRENIYSTGDYNDAVSRFEFETGYQSRYAALAKTNESESGFIYVIFFDNDGSIFNRVEYEF